MAGRLCGTCGGPLTDGGCDCPPAVATGFGGGREQDAPTTVIPVIGAPELVRPYISPTGLVAPQDPGDGPEVAYETYAVPGIDAPHLVRSSRARVLAGQLVAVKDRPYPATGRDSGPGGPGERTRRSRERNGNGNGRGRRAALIAAGALAVAGLGTAAALAPSLLNGSGTDQAHPLPGLTVALPTAPPVSSATGSPAPAAVRTTGSAPASASAPPSASAARTGSAPGTPTGGAPGSSAPASAPPSTAAPGRTPPTPGPPTQPPVQAALQLGDQGPAVATLQTELSKLWIDPALDASGTYDSRTEQDVSTFQRRYRVRGDPDGVFGPNSQARMNQLIGQQHQHH
jgi:hypothetical protein